MSAFSRPRTLSGLSSLALALLVSLQGCDCGSTGVEDLRFPCTTDDECVSGYACRSGECRRRDSEPPDGGGTDGGLPDGGTGHGPTQLTFLTPGQSVEAGKCSAAVELEVRNAEGTATPVDAATALVLGSEPGTGFSFYRDATCETATSNVTVEAGSSRATFYFRGTVARSVRISATASGLGTATQDETLSPAAPTGLAFITPPQSLVPGACSSVVELELRDAFDNPSSFSSQMGVTLLAETRAGFSFFADAECTSPLTEAVFSPGVARTRLYFRGWSTGEFSLSATGKGLSSASQLEKILPIVRTGSCVLPEDEAWVECPIPIAQVDLSKTVLFFQASADDTSPDSGSVRCSLTDTDAITCSRNDADDAVNILWQTAELSSGLKVQHLEASCESDAPTIQIPIRKVSSLQNTFLLVSSENDGSGLTEDDFYTAQLVSESQVDLEFSEECGDGFKASLQVVESESVNITRGVTAPMVTAEHSVTVPPADIASSALLFTYRVSNADALNLCDRVLRGELTSPTTITFSRGADGDGCTTAIIDAISWERLEFSSATAQHVKVSMDPTTRDTHVPIDEVDMTRSLVFASGQWLGGQAGGECSYRGEGPLGAAVGWYKLDSRTRLSVSRAAAAGTARWSATILQLAP